MTEPVQTKPLEQMTISDMEGQLITVTDLEVAIRQAARFKDYRHDPPKPIADARQQAYWKDIYNKLLQLRVKAGQWKPI